MGTSNVRAFKGSEDRSLFTSQLLKELDILQDLVDTGEIESNVKRIGAELEIFIIDENGNPNPIANKILEKLPDCFTSEYSDYVIELNLEPHLVNEGTFNSIKRELQSNLNLVAAMLKKHDSRYLLVGILPSFDTSHLSVDSITHEKRYGLLHNFVHSLRNEKHETFIRGIDTLDEEDGLNVYGGALASYQMHLQVSPDNAVDMLNISQLITPPLLAIGVNSPLFMERALWHETRVPLFEQSTDQRDLREKKLDLEPRVSFGKDWYKGSVKDIFEKELSEYDLWLNTNLNTEDSNKQPELNTLSFQNGLIYRWNRLCYGVLNGVPTLRIENRYLPAGPTIDDNLDLQFFWTMLMIGHTEYLKDQISNTPFWKVKENFNKAANNGIATELFWDGKYRTVSDILLEILLPMAKQTATSLGLEDDIERLNKVQSKAEKRLTGAAWQLERFFESPLPVTDTTKAISRTMSEYQYKDIELVNWTDELLDITPTYASDIPGESPLRVSKDYPADYTKNLAMRQEKSYVTVYDRSSSLEYTIRTIDISSKNGEPIKDIELETIVSIDYRTPIDKVKELVNQGKEEIAITRDNATVKVVRPI